MNEFFLVVSLVVGIIYQIFSTILGFLFSHLFELILTLVLLFVSLMLIRIHDQLSLLNNKLEEGSSFKDKFLK